jgi:hypothetical protein
MSLLNRFSEWLGRFPLWLFVAAITLASVFKGGISFTPLGTDELQAFPTPPNNWSALSYGMRSVVFITGQDGDLAFGIVGFFAVIMSLALLTYFAYRKFEPVVARVFLALIVVGPIGMALMNRIGRNDVFVILGAAIIAFYGKRIVPFLIGLFIMILGNPEQTVVAFFVLFILSMIPTLRSWRRTAGLGFVVALAVFVPLSMYARASGVKSRVEFLPEYLSNSFYAFAANLPLSIFAAYGAVWLVIGWVFLQISGRSRFWLVVGLGAAPAFVAMITVDQTRVIVGVTTLAVLVILHEYLPKIKNQLDVIGFNPILGVTVAVVLFLPIIDIWGSSGHARTPYLWIFTSIVPQIKTLLIG